MSVELILLLGSVCAGLAAAVGYYAWVGVVDTINRAYEQDLRRRMDEVAVDTSTLSAWMRSRVTGAVAVGVVIAFGLGMFPIGVLAGVVTFVVLPVVLERRIEHNRALIRDQLVTAARNLAGQVRGQAILTRGLRRVAEQMADPLGALLRGCTEKLDKAALFKDVLTELKDRVRMDYLSLFTITLVIAHEKKEGAALADILDNIAHSLSENQRVDRKRESDTAAGRLLVNLLACFPLVFLGLFYLLDPDAVGILFSSVVGQVILCMVAGIVWFSLWLARRILGQVV